MVLHKAGSPLASGLTAWAVLACASYPLAVPQLRILGAVFALCAIVGGILQAGGSCLRLAGLLPLMCAVALTLWVEIPGQARNDGRGVRNDNWPRDGEETATRLMSIPDSVLLRNRCLKAGQFAGEGERWTIKDFGPVMVPKRGMTIVLDSVARRHYARVIAWEERCASLGLETYTFRQDWYFFVGDNQLDSRDSRYFGFVPAEFVIGIVPGR